MGDEDVGMDVELGRAVGTIAGCFRCPFSFSHSITDLKQPTFPVTSHEQIPACPGCGKLCVPQILQFDEGE